MRANVFFRGRNTERHKRIAARKLTTIIITAAITRGVLKRPPTFVLSVFLVVFSLLFVSCPVVAIGRTGIRGDVSIAIARRWNGFKTSGARDCAAYKLAVRPFTRRCCRGRRSAAGDALDHRRARQAKVRLVCLIECVPTKRAMAAV